LVVIIVIFDNLYFTTSTWTEVCGLLFSRPVSLCVK